MTLTGDGFAARHGVLAAGYGSRPDPEDPAQVLAMPMVLHLPKVDPPARSDLLAAAASATVALCLDERVGPDDDGEPGPWQGAFREWADARIRKVARRARGAQWLAAQDVDGVTVDVAGAQARALVPGPVGALDPRIRKLQIGGTDLEHDEPGPVPGGVPTLWVNASLGMSVGKAAAQVGHASMILAGAMPVERVRRWAADGYRCAVRDADPGQWAQLCDEVARGAAVAVRDAGFTEVAPGSMTVIAPIP
ncbi:aminoacyl-tRNA hydrolase [Prescottella equi]|uniref:aminoacyl-tRNA hydrolase n=1 Tax=Rhodococcus hoagii TaxID=43767 RepID=UPI000A103B71|nr:aminoacyl-tRNA hydrolase [Prescottella equi]MBM4696127.1 peptidyl-tRNA hydrolase [Prescottella equi]NKS32384.1 peptidyl-tRNA hydrolase [Prescottella equi]NKS52618.1 peptidyl-tRNA hydrolase [Prescottella equi]ORM12394.1 peptidyl-tRNA hydrolase [Prescottella equi]